MSGGLRPRGYNLPVSSIDKVPPRAKGRHVSPLFRRDWGRKGSEIWDGYRTRSTCRSSQIFLQRKSFSSLCLGTDEDRDSPRRMTVTFPQELTSMRSRYRIRSIRFTLLAAPAFLESPRCRAPIQPQERDSPRPPGLQLCDVCPCFFQSLALGVCARQLFHEAHILSGTFRKTPVRSIITSALLYRTLLTRGGTVGDTRTVA